MYSAEKKEHFQKELEQVLKKNGVAVQNKESYLSASVTAMLGDGKLIANPETINSMKMKTVNSM